MTKKHLHEMKRINNNLKYIGKTLNETNKILKQLTEDEEVRAEPKVKIPEPVSSKSW